LLNNPKRQTVGLIPGDIFRAFLPDKRWDSPSDFHSLSSYMYIFTFNHPFDAV